MKNEIVLKQDKIQIDSIKLAGGGRLLRLTEPILGFALEKKLDAMVSVVQQKEQLFQMLEAALKVAQKNTA